MYKHLVVRCDGQDRSQKAVQAAAELAEALSATVHVVTAVPKDRFRDLDGGPERRAVDVESWATLRIKSPSDLKLKDYLRLGQLRRRRSRVGEVQ
jgi:hypothetical protein